MAQRFVRAQPLPAERHPKADCWRLRRRDGCVATLRSVRRDGALGAAPDGKAVMGPALLACDLHSPVRCVATARWVRRRTGKP